MNFGTRARQQGGQWPPIADVTQAEAKSESGEATLDRRDGGCVPYQTSRARSPWRWDCRANARFDVAPAIDTIPTVALRLPTGTCVDPRAREPSGSGSGTRADLQSRAECALPVGQSFLRSTRSSSGIQSLRLRRVRDTFRVNLGMPSPSFNLRGHTM